MASRSYAVSAFPDAGRPRTVIPPVKQIPAADGEPEYLRHYRYDTQLARDAFVLIAVKNLTQERKNRERLERLCNHVPRIGSPIARPAEEGIVGSCMLSVDWLSDGCFSDCIRLNDPIGVDVCEEMVALSSRDRVYLFDAAGDRLETLENPWFATLHSVVFSSDGDRILVASSGFDTIFEVSVASGKVLWEWNSWEHGYSVSVTGKSVFTRGDRRPSLDAAEGREIIHVDPSHFGAAGVPIWHRPAHLNGAAYDRDGNVLATLFHPGHAVKIDKKSKTCVELLSQLNKPHAFLPTENGGYVVTSTAGENAQTVFLDDRWRVTQRVSPSGLLGIRDGFPDSEEWMQYTTDLGEGLSAMVDIHRSSIFIVSPATRRYRRIGFPRNWAVQMVIRVSGDLRLPPQHLLPTLR